MFVNEIYRNMQFTPELINGFHAVDIYLHQNNKHIIICVNRPTASRANTKLNLNRY